MIKFTMKTWAQWCLTAAIIFGIADFIVVNFGAEGATSSFSAFMINIGLRAQFFNYALGIVTGHLMAPMYEEGKEPGKLPKWQVARISICAVILYEAAKRILITVAGL